MLISNYWELESKVLIIRSWFVKESDSKLFFLKRWRVQSFFWQYFISYKMTIKLDVLCWFMKVWAACNVGNELIMILHCYLLNVSCLSALKSSKVTSYRMLYKSRHRIQLQNLNNHIFFVFFWSNFFNNRSVVAWNVLSIILFLTSKNNLHMNQI